MFQRHTSAFFIRIRGLAAAALLGLAGLGAAPALAQSPVDSKAAPNDFVQTVADNALDAVKKDQAVKSGNLESIKRVVNEYVLPYVNFEKTTRLAAGRHWRQATPSSRRRWSKHSRAR